MSRVPALSVTSVNSTLEGRTIRVGIVNVSDFFLVFFVCFNRFHIEISKII